MVLKYFPSITTRDGTVVTATNDNFTSIAALFTDMTEDTSTGAITISGECEYSGQLSSVDTDIVCFNRVITFNSEDASLHGPSGGRDGVHWYFVNCVFYLQGIIRFQGQTPQLGPSNVYNLGMNSRLSNVSNEEDYSTINFYNCIVVNNTDSTSADNTTSKTGMVLGDIYNCRFESGKADVGNLVIWQMGGCTFKDSSFDYSIFKQVSGKEGSQGTAMELASAGFYNLDGITLVNQYLYPFTDRTINTIVGYECVQNFLFSASGSGTPDNPPVIRLYCADSSEDLDNGPTVILSSPKVNLQLDGNIFWRAQDSNGYGRIIASQQVKRVFYYDVDKQNPEPDVAMEVITNVGFATAGDGSTIQVETSNSTRRFVTNTNGKFAGTYDFEDGSTVASTEFEEIHIPVSYFSPVTTDSADDFHSNTFHFTTTVEVFALWGDINTTRSITSSVWAVDQEDANNNYDGYWIATDNEDGVASLQDVMSEYNRTVATLVGKATASTGSISFNDLIALYKHACWLRTIARTNWTSSASTGDISGSTVNRIRIKPTVTVSEASGSDILEIEAPEENDIVQLTVADSDAVKHIKTEAFYTHEVDATLQLDGGGVGHLESDDIRGLRFFDNDSLPTDFDTNYSVKNVRITTGTGSGHGIKLDTATDGNAYIFNNLDEDSVIRLDRTDINGNRVNVYFTGTIPSSITLGNTNVDAFRYFDFVFDLGAGNSFDSSKLSTVRWASSTNSTVGTFSDSYTTFSTGTTFTVRVTAQYNHTHFWFSMCYDGYDPVRFTDIEEEPATTELTTTTVNTLDFDITDFNLNDEFDLTDTDVTAIASATADILVNIDETTGAGESDFTDAICRAWLRRYIVESDQFMDAMAQGFVATNFFIFNSSTVGVGSKTRLKISHTSSTNVVLPATPMIAQSDESDLSRQLTVTDSQRAVYFARKTEGASALQVQAIVDALQDVIEDDNDEMKSKLSAINSASSLTLSHSETIQEAVTDTHHQQLVIQAGHHTDTPHQRGIGSGYGTLIKGSLSITNFIEDFTVSSIIFQYDEDDGVEAFEVVLSAAPSAELLADLQSVGNYIKVSFYNQRNYEKEFHFSDTGIYNSDDHRFIWSNIGEKFANVIETPFDGGERTIEFVSASTDNVKTKVDGVKEGTDHIESDITVIQSQTSVIKHSVSAVDNESIVINVGEYEETLTGNIYLGWRSVSPTFGSIRSGTDATIKVYGIDLNIVNIYLQRNINVNNFAIDLKNEVASDLLSLADRQILQAEGNSILVTLHTKNKGDMSFTKQFSNAIFNSEGNWILWNNISPDFTNLAVQDLPNETITIQFLTSNQDTVYQESLGIKETADSIKGDTGLIPATL